MVKLYQRIVSLVCIACETCECERCNVEDLAKRIIDDVRTNTIDECIKKLAKSEDTILSDRQYYVLEQLKEKK